MFCPICEEFVDTNVFSKRETNIVNDDIEITLTVDVAFCKQCGHELFDPRLEDKSLKFLYNIVRIYCGIWERGIIEPA